VATPYITLDVTLASSRTVKPFFIYCA
jgi:hypothetical protein